MVKATIGKTTIEGTPEEVAYILNGLLTAQEEGTSVEVIHEAAPETEKTIGEALGILNRRGKPYKYHVPALCRTKVAFGVNKKGIPGKGWHKIKYRKFLGCTLMAWLKKNYPNLESHKNRKKVVKALRAAGVPYHIPKRRLNSSIGSAVFEMRKRKLAKGYTKDEVEDLNEQA